MTVQLFKLLVPFVIVFEVIMCCGQSPVTWNFSAAPLHAHETTISITAEVPAGWHIYSQSMKEGGPIPTRIKFAPAEDYILQGMTVEQGDADRFYDYTYEMEIIWYTGVVTFMQRVMLTKPGAIIKGSIEYMTCNNAVCVPGRQSFRIEVPPAKSEKQP